MDTFVTRKPDGPLYTSKSHSQVSGGLESAKRPTKRLKTDEIPDSESESSEIHMEDGTAADDSISRLPNSKPQQSQPTATDIENALPPSQPEQEAIQEYEQFKLSHDPPAPNVSFDKDRSLWLKGRSSIYVDAFNLALDTVLDEESHLFDEKEKEIFRQWKDLHYEAQYVRLFLRKTDAWHRSSRLGYYDDVSDPDRAIETLQSVRPLPKKTISASQEAPPGIEISDSLLGEAFTFADTSESYIRTVEEAAGLLNLEELKAMAKEAKVQGRNKLELKNALCRMSQQQSGLMAMGLSRHNSRDSVDSAESDADQVRTKASLHREDSNREQHFLNKILAILGPCIRLSPLPFRLFERVHLVFYRSTEWTEKSLTTIILAKIARRHFPDYIVCRTSTIFASRMHLLEFEASIKLEAEVDRILEFNEIPGEAGFQKVMEIYAKVYPRWKTLVHEEQEKEARVYEMGEGAYLRRFTPAHSYTRIIHKASGVMARLKEHLKEYSIVSELLDQKIFHMARRGSWYQRKALLEEHYMPELDENPVSQDSEQQKKHWKRIAIATCEAGLQDPDCHLIYHYDLQKRLLKLEKKVRIPRRLQHDFGHVRLADPLNITVEGIQLKRDLLPKPGRQAASTKTMWLDELDSGGECSVEEMCLSHFRHKGWKGYHAEGGIVRTIFAYLFYDIMFLYIPNVFQTAYQTCPLDLHTDAFFPVRASEINHRLVEIANGEGERIVREVWEKEHEKKTSIVGLNWDFELDDVTELVSCFEGSALAAVCKVMAQEYKQRGGGIPDLILWRKSKGASQIENEQDGPGQPTGEVMFAEVKSANDRLSDTQRLWIHVLTAAGVKVALCNAAAKEIRVVD